MMLDEIPSFHFFTKKLCRQHPRPITDVTPFRPRPRPMPKPRPVRGAAGPLSSGAAPGRPSGAPLWARPPAAPPKPGAPATGRRESCGPCQAGPPGAPRPSSAPAPPRSASDSVLERVQDKVSPGFKSASMQGCQSILQLRGHVKCAIRSRRASVQTRFLPRNKYTSWPSHQSHADPPITSRC